MLNLIANFYWLFAAAGDSCAKPRFFGLVPWYEYLKVERDAANQCSVVGINTSQPWSGVILPVGLAIVDDMLRIGAMVAFGYLIYGGIKYMTSQGSADGIKNAQNTVINAVVGLMITLIAIGLVNFIGSRIG